MKRFFALLLLLCLFLPACAKTEYQGDYYREYTADSLRDAHRCDTFLCDTPVDPDVIRDTVAKTPEVLPESLQGLVKSSGNYQIFPVYSFYLDDLSLVCFLFSKEGEASQLYPAVIAKDGTIAEYDPAGLFSDFSETDEFTDLAAHYDLGVKSYPQIEFRGLRMGKSRASWLVELNRDGYLRTLVDNIPVLLDWIDPVSSVKEAQNAYRKWLQDDAAIRSAIPYWEETDSFLPTMWGAVDPHPDRVEVISVPLLDADGNAGEYVMNLHYGREHRLFAERVYRKSRTVVWERVAEYDESAWTQDAVSWTFQPLESSEFIETVNGLLNKTPKDTTVTGVGFTGKKFYLITED